MKFFLFNIFLFGLISLAKSQNLDQAVKACEGAITALEGRSLHEAEALFEKADKIFQEKLKGLAAIEHCLCLANWSQALLEKEQAEAALEPLERAAEQLELIEEQPPGLKQQLLLREASLNYQLQHYISAKNRAREFLNISREEQKGDHPEQYEAIAIAAHAYLFIDYPETAFKYAERGLKLAKSKGHYNEWRASFLEAMIDSYWQQGEQEKALNLLKNEWLPLLKKLYTEQSKQFAEAYHLLACYELNYDHYQAADKALNKSFEIYKGLSIQKGVEVTSLQTRWFQTHLKQSAFEEAWPHLDAALEAICLSCKAHEIPTTTVALKEFVQQHFFSSKRALISLLHEYQLLYLLQYEQRPALDLLNKAIGFGEAAISLGEDLWKEEAMIKKDLKTFLEKSLHWQLIMYKKLQQASPSEQNIEAIAALIWRKKLLNIQDLLKSGALSPVAEVTLDREKALEVELSIIQKKLKRAFVKRDYEGIQKINKQYLEIRKALFQLQKNISKQSLLSAYNWFYAPSLISVKQLRKEMPAEAIFIEYAFFEEVLYALVIEKNKVGFYELDLNALELDEIIANFENLLNAPTLLKRNPEYLWNQYLYRGEYAYQLLLKPLLKDVDLESNKLCIAGDGPLHQLTFEALLSTSSDLDIGSYEQLPYLVKDYELSYQYSFYPLVEDLAIENELKPKILLAIEDDKLIRKKWNKLLGRKQLMKYSKLPDSTSLRNSNLALLKGETIWIGEYYALRIGEDSLNLISMGADSWSQMQLFSILGTSMDVNRSGTKALDFYLLFKIGGGANMMHGLWSAGDSLSLELQHQFLKAATKGEALAKAWQQTQLNYLEKAKDSKAHPFYWSGYKLWAQPQDQLKISQSKGASGSWKMGRILLTFLLLILVIFLYVRAKK